MGKTFGAIDEDRSGEVDQEELRTLLESFGEAPKPYKMKQMMDHVDQDESGTVNFEEFVWMMKEIKEGKYSAFGAVLRRNMMNGALVPLEAAKAVIKDFDVWLHGDQEKIHEIQLCREVRKRISLADESFQQIYDSLSKKDQAIITKNGIDKWT